MTFNLPNPNWKSQTLLILILTSLVQLSAAYITNVITVLLPDISNDLNIPLNLLNWISLIFLMSIISVGIPLNRCIKQWGVKRCIKFSIFGLMIGLILFSISPIIEFLLIFRIMQGVTIAVMCISIYMIIILGIPDEHIGKTLGIVGACGYIGTMIAPSIAGFISYYLSWRYAFLIIVPILVFELILIYLIKDEWSTDKKALDIKGSLIYVIMIIFIVFGLSEIDNGILPLITGLSLLILFIYYERNIKNPFYNLKLLHNLKYVIGNIGAMSTNFIIFIATYTLNLYLQVILGLDTRFVGLLLFITPIVMVFVAPFSGKLSDKHDPNIISAIALVIIGISLVILLLLDYLPFYMIIVALIIQGLGYGLFSSPNNKNVLTSVSVEDLSDASALLSSGKDIGKLLSLSIFNIFCELILKNENMKSDIVGLSYSIKLMLIVCIILLIFCLISTIISKFKFKNEENPKVVALIIKYFQRPLKELLHFNFK